LAIPAPIPRDPPVTSATLLFNLDMKSPLYFYKRFGSPLILELLSTFRAAI
jgi:hypothetical protein